MCNSPMVPSASPDNVLWTLAVLGRLGSLMSTTVLSAALPSKGTTNSLSNGVFGSLVAISYVGEIGRAHV